MVSSVGLTAAGLLLLALTLIAEAQTKAGHGDGTVIRNLHRRSLAASSGVGGGGVGGGEAGAPTPLPKGGESTVSSTSYTLIANRTAKDNASKPYTLRWNLDGCTQYPEAVAGKFTTIYAVWNSIDSLPCQNATLYRDDNCDGRVVYLNESALLPRPFSASALLDMNTPGPIRSVMCTTALF
ncbi:unnamed protein product [Closterium sp. NIES-54]